MIEVTPQTRNALRGLLGVILAAGWVAFAIIGNGSTVFLTVMIVLTILFGGLATYGVRVPRNPNRS